MGKTENFPLGIVGGIIGATLGAAIWGAIVALTGWQIGLFAVGVGFLTGLGVQYLGHGTTIAFGIIGAILALLGCILGDVFAVVIMVSKQTGTGMTEIIMNVNGLIDLVKANFKPLDLVFYAIALYFGYRYSMKPAAASEKHD